MASDDLAAFLRAQWDAEEKKARRIKATRHGALIVAPGDGESPSVIAVEGDKLLRDVEAKRRILDEHAHIPDDGINFTLAEQARAEDTIKLLALPYADVDGYREDWRP